MKFFLNQFLFFFLSCNIAFCSPLKICLSGKIENMLPDYKTALLNAVNFALTENNLTNEVIIESFFFDNKPLAAIDAYHKMVDADCSAIIGLEYLSDLLLITKIQPNENIPIFTSFSSSLSHEKYPNNIFLLSPSYNFLAEKMMFFLEGQLSPRSNILVITEINRSDLKKHKEAYTKILSNKKLSYDTFDFVENENGYDYKIREIVAQKPYDFVFLFSGSVGSANIINAISNYKITFIGTENFGSSSNQSLYVRLRDKEINAFSIRNVDFLNSNIIAKKFSLQYHDKYHINPNALSAYTYDSMKIILNAFQKYGTISPENLLKSNYYGVTGVRIYNNKFYRSKDYVILSIQKDGFHEA